MGMGEMGTGGMRERGWGGLGIRWGKWEKKRGNGGGARLRCRHGAPWFTP